MAAGPLSPAVALHPLAGVLLLLAVAFRAVGVSLPAAAASRLAVVEPPIVVFTNKRSQAKVSAVYVSLGSV